MIADGRGADINPFRDAWRHRDVDEWLDFLATDIVLHSPMLKTPFRGRQAARELYSVLFRIFGEVEIAHESSAARSQAFFWVADLRGQRIEGADLLRFDDEGKISEIRVFIRPLVGIASFASAVGPPIAAERGRLRAFLSRLTAQGLSVTLSLVDPIASRLTQPR